jgi:hypothetical protein
LDERFHPGAGPQRCALFSRRIRQDAAEAGAEEASARLSGRWIYLNEAILEEFYSFAVIWNPFKRRFFLLHRAARFNIDRHVLVERI